MKSICCVALPDDAPEGGLERFLWDYLNPYYIELEVPPYKHFHGTEEDAADIARLRGFASVDELAQDMDDDEGVDGGRVFYIATNNPDGRWDWFIVQRVCAAEELTETYPHSVVSREGVWSSGGDYGYSPRKDWEQGGVHPDNEEPRRLWKLFLRTFFDEHATCRFAVLMVHS